MPPEEWNRRKTSGKKRETFTVEEAEPPPVAQVTAVEENEHVLVDFSGSAPFPVHSMKCGEFWRAKAGHSSWDVNGYKRYKSHLILSRDDCKLRHECCSVDKKASTKTQKSTDDDDEFETWMIHCKLSRMGICKAKLDIEDRDGKVKTVTVALDTASNRDICLKQLANRVVDRSTASTRVCGGETKLGPIVAVKVVRPNKEPLELSDVRVGSNNNLPHGCQLLLGRGTLQRLRVAMDYHLDYAGSEVPRLRVRKPRKISDEKDEKDEKLVASPLYQEPTREEVFLSEAKVRQFMVREDSKCESDSTGPSMNLEGSWFGSMVSAPVPTPLATQSARVQFPHGSNYRYRYTWS